MKRMLCFLTALTAVLTAAACQNNSAVTQGTASSDTAHDTDTAAETKEPSLLESLGETDLGGYTFTAFDCNPYTEWHINMPGDKLTGEVVNDALFKRDSVIEERLNCRIEYYQENKFELLKNAVASGEDLYQIVYHPMTGLSGAATAGLLANLCEVPHLELDKAWWNPLLYENLRMKDAMYITSSDLAPSVYQMLCCLFLNLKLYEDYGIQEDIFQTVIDGKWTMDLMKTMTKGMNQDLNMDNKWTIEDDFFGTALPVGSETVLNLLIGMGVQLSHISEDRQTLTCDLLNDTRAMQALEEISDSFQKIGSREGKYDFSNILFKDNRALFLAHKLETAAVHLRDMEADYLILPPPKLDEAQETYYSFLSPHGCCFIAMPLTAQENEKAGLIAEAMARESYQNVRPVSYELVYKEKDTRDPRSADVLDILLNHMYIDFASLYEFGGLGNMLSSIVFDEKPMISLLEKRKKLTQNAVAKFEEKWNPLG